MKNEKIKFGINYIDIQSPLHQLNGITKFVLFMAWITIVLTTFDLRLILIMNLLGLGLLKMTKVDFDCYKSLFIGTLSVLGINALFMFAVAPNQGSILIGTNTPFLNLPAGYSLTQETLYYLILITLKYFSMFPIALVFVFTTHPTEFASSLNRIGVPYKIAYAISLTLRYLPDVKTDFTNIMHAQQARGIDLSKKVPLMMRFKGIANILIPLIFSSLDRAEKISNGMILRGFGQKTSRTWYSTKPLTKQDGVILILLALCTLAALLKRYFEPQLLWYPF